MKHILFYILFLLPFTFYGQEHNQLKIHEDTLVHLLHKARNESVFKKAYQLNNQFEDHLRKVTKIADAFNYPFDSLSKLMSTIKSPDGKFRIFNWNYELENEEQFYSCLIMKYDKNTDNYTIIKLFDGSKNAKNPEFTQYDKKNWYGALYYSIIPVKKEKSTYYTLLGWDGNNKFSNKKIIETMAFQSKDNVKFGFPYFTYPQEKTKRRVIFQYNKQSYMSLKYFKEKKEDLIVFDHLIPKSPQLEGMYDWYVTDLSFNAFKLENEKWIFIGQVKKNSKKDLRDRPYNTP